MTTSVTLEVVGYSDSECSPFPCDEDRTCGLSSCAPSASLVAAYDALRHEVEKEFDTRVHMKLTLIDDHVPDHILTIYEQEHPAIPMIILNGSVLPLGRIAWPPIREAITTYLDSLKR